MVGPEQTSDLSIWHESIYNLHLGYSLAGKQEQSHWRSSHGLSGRLWAWGLLVPMDWRLKDACWTVQVHRRPTFHKMRGEHCVNYIKYCPFIPLNMFPSFLLKLGLGLEAHALSFMRVNLREFFFIVASELCSGYSLCSWPWAFWADRGGASYLPL